MTVFRKALLICAVLAGCVIALRFVIGPFKLLLPINAPLNLESIFGLAMIILFATACTKETLKHRPAMPSSADSRLTVAAGFALVLLATAALGRALAFYFLSDDFSIVTLAAGWFPNLAGTLFTTGQNDGFFRPIGAISLAIDAHWAAFNPVAWHVTGLALHALSCLLVWRLAARLGASRFAAFFAAALFALHGTRPEAVAWIAARYDLLATFFVLLALLLFTKSLRELGRRRYLCEAGALLSMTLAVLSKESAYIFPFLALLCLLAQPRVGRPPLTRMLPYFLVSAAIFAYRWSLFGGLGGYRIASSGRPQALAIGLPAIKALAMRLWAALFFPVNWSTEPGIVLSLLLLAYLTIIVWIGFRARSDQRVWLALGFVLVSAIPPLQLLAISGDLLNSRVLYLPSVGFCLLLAFVIDGLAPRARIAAASVILLFNLAALEHNLVIWQYASDRTRQACAAASGFVQENRMLTVSGMPHTIRGVSAFANGFAECVQFGPKQPTAIRILPPGAAPAGDAVHLQWDNARDQWICTQNCL